MATENETSGEQRGISIEKERADFERMQKAHAEVLRAQEEEHKKVVEMLKRQLEEANKSKELANGTSGSLIGKDNSARERIRGVNCV